MADLAELQISIGEKTPGAIVDMRQKIDDLNEKVNELEDSQKRAAAGAGQAEQSNIKWGRSFQHLQRSALAAAAAVGAAAAAGFFAGRNFIRAASEVEALETRLFGLSDSAEDAADRYQRFAALAGSTPFSLQGVVEAGVTLEAFGAQADLTLGAIADLAAFMGTDIVEAAQAAGRAWAAGAGAADILRERGILKIIADFKGIDDITKVTLPELRRAMFETFTDPAAKIAGSADRLSKAWVGMTSNVEDALFTLRAEIGAVVVRSDAFKAAGESLAVVIRDVATAVKEWRTENQQLIDNEVTTWLGDVDSLSVAAARSIGELAAEMAEFARSLSGLEPALAGVAAVLAGLAFRSGRLTLGTTLTASALTLVNADFGKAADGLDKVTTAASEAGDRLESTIRRRRFAEGVDDLTASFVESAQELQSLQAELAAFGGDQSTATTFGGSIAGGVLQQQVNEQRAQVAALGDEFARRGEQIPDDVRKIAEAVGVELPKALATRVPNYGDDIEKESGKAARGTKEAAAAVQAYADELAALRIVLDSGDPFQAEAAGEAIRKQTLALLGLADASRIAAEAESRRAAEAEAVARVADPFRREAEQARQQAEALRRSIRPAEELAERMREIRRLAAFAPDVITPEVETDAINRAALDLVRLGDEGSRQAEIMADAFSKAGERVKSAILGAIDGARIEGRDLLRAVLLDIADVALDELIFQPINLGIRNAIRNSREQRAAGDLIAQATGAAPPVAIDVTAAQAPPPPLTVEVVAPPTVGADSVAANAQALDAATTSARGFGATLTDTGQGIATGFGNVLSDLSVGVREAIVGIGQAAGSLVAFLLGGGGSQSFGEAIGLGALSGLVGGLVNVGGAAVGNYLDPTASSPSTNARIGEVGFFGAESSAQTATFEPASTVQSINVVVEPWDTPAATSSAMTAGDAGAGYTRIQSVPDAPVYDTGSGLTFVPETYRAPQSSPTTASSRPAAPIVVQTTLNLQSIDPSRAGDVLQGAYPQFEARLVSSLESGGTRLSRAVKGAAGTRS